MTSSAVGEACSLGEVCPIGERSYELGDLTGVRRAVSVDHGDDVAGRRGETASKSIALAGARLHHHTHVRPKFAGDLHCVIQRVTVNEYEFVDVLRHLR